MSINQHSFLEKLPAEILYRIFDCLDTKTILISLRHTCRRLRDVIKNYDHYILDFKQTSRSDFKYICRLINPQQVKSLILSQQNPKFDHTILFDELFGVKDYTHVRSLTLIAIKESRLRAILKHINVSSLISLSLEIGEHKKSHDHVTSTVLSSLLTRSNLRKLVLKMQSNRIEAIDWPDRYTIEHFEIGGCTHFDQIKTILLCMPRLKTLVIDCHSMQSIRQTSFTFCQTLTTLSLEKMNINIDHLVFLLRPMSSLTSLKLIGNGNLLDGHRWEQFIQTNLPLLKKFMFFFNQDHTDAWNYPDIEGIVASFRTPFWLELKKLFVACEYNINVPQQITLYSIPSCVPFLNSISQRTKISVSTHDTIINKEASMTVNIDKIGFNFQKLSSSDIERQWEPKLHPLFRTMKTLGLIFGSDRPVGWIPFISLFINLTTITKIILVGKVIIKAYPTILTDIKSLLEQACNVSSLTLCASFSTHKSPLTADDICSIIPIHIQHLKVSIKNLDEVKIVLERLEHLSTAYFFFDDTPCYNEFNDWFKTKKQNLSYQTEPSSVSVWHKQNRISSSELRINNKRIKLDTDHHE